MKFGWNVIQVNMHQLMKSDFGFTSHFQDDRYDISHRKVLPPGECNEPSVRCIRSSIGQFLIYSTFVLFHSIRYLYNIYLYAA